MFRVHCDKSIGVFHDIALSAAGTSPIARNFPRFKIRAIAGFYLTLGQLPAIAGNIPRFYYINLLLNILTIFKYYYYFRIKLLDDVTK